MRSWIGKSVWMGALLAAAGLVPAGHAADSIVRALDVTMTRGTTNRLQVVLEAQGTENAIGFSLAYDTNLLTLVRAARGVDSTNAGATFIVNSRPPRVGCILGLDIGSMQVFPVGTHQIVDVFFAAAPGSGVITTSVVMTNQPTTNEVSNADAIAIPALFQGATVTLAGACAYALSTSTVAAPAAGGTNEVSVLTDAGCAWTVSNPLSWVTVLSGATGSGNGPVSLSVAPNTEMSPRSGNLTIAGQTLTVNQAGYVCAYALSPTNRNHGPGAASNSFTVATGSNCAWTVSTTNAWIAITSDLSGTGPATVQYVVASNPSTTERLGSIQVADQALVVRQSGITCEYSISPTNRMHGPGANTNSVNVTATTAGCGWTSANTNAWISILSGGTGSGDGLVTYSFLANPSSIARTGLVQIAGQTFTLVQLGATCDASLSPTNRNHGYGATANSFTLSLAAGCPWTVDNTNDWISIQSPLSGTGTATISYSVTANPSIVARTGLVFVAGQVYVLSQSPAPCAYDLTPSSRSFSASGGSAQVSVATPVGCAWSVVNTNGWITIDAGASGNGNGTVSYTVIANPNMSARSGTLVIGGEPFVVNQAALQCTFSLSPTNRNHGVGAATNLFTLTTSNACAWSVVNTNDWITLLSPTNGTGSATINYSITANASTNERVGYLTIGGLTASVRQAGVVCTASLSPLSRNHGNTAKTNFFTLTTDAACPWTVSNANPWITIQSPASGSGNATITYVVAANPDGYARTGLIHVASQVFTLTQDPATCTFTVTPTSRSHGAAAETGQVTVTGPLGCPWTSINTNAWITITAGASGTGSGVLSYSIEANPVTVARSGVLTIAGRAFTVNQAAAACAFTLAPTNGVHGSGAETGMVNVTTTAGCSWSTSDTNDWITILNASGTGNGTMMYAVEPNLDTVPRTGIVSIAGIRFTIAQAAGPCVYRLSTSSRSHGAGAATNTLGITASNNCPWTASATNDWISLLSGASGSGTGLVTYAIEPNASSSERTGRVFVADQVLTLRQAGLVCSFTLSPTNRNHGYGAATNIISVSTSPGCAWTASTTNTWLMLLSGASGSGSGTVTYAAEANPLTVGRTGQVTIADRTFVVTQDPRPCTFSLSPASRLHGYSPVTNSITLTTLASCNWTVVNTNPWVTITPPTAGIGNGVIEYSVAANTVPVERVALIQIGDETFTLTQRAAPCLYELSPTNRVHTAGADTGLVSVITFSNCTWTATTTNTWVTILPGASGQGNGSFSYAIAANTNAIPRNGYIDVAGETFRVTQAGAPCVFMLSPTNLTHGSGRETGVVAVASATGCDWSTVNTNDWIDIDTGHSGSGNGTVRYIVIANPLLTPRSGSFLIAGQSVRVTQAGRVCTYRLSPTNRLHGHAATSNSFTVTASNDCSWAASTADSWISITDGASGAGNGVVSYTLSANPASTGRTGTVAVADQVYVITQSAAPCTVDISPTGRFHGSGAASNEIALTTALGCAWDIVNTNNWITFAPPLSGTGSATLSYQVAENPDAVERVGLILIGGQSLILTQRAAVCTYALSASTRTHGFAAATNFVTLSTLVGCAWTVANTNDWIHLTSAATGSGDGTISYRVEPNPLTFWRTGVVTVVDQTLTLIQRPAPCSFAFTPTNGAYAHPSVTAQVAVATSSNCPWEATTTNAWIEILAGATGTGNGSVSFVIQSNSSPLARSGAVLIGDAVFPVTQAGVPCEFALAPTSRSHAFNAETAQVTVTTIPLCSWNLVNTNNWIEVLSAPTSGSGTLTYAVEENPAMMPRSGVVVIGGQPFQVTQQGAPCVYRLSPTNRMHGYGATTGSVAITAATGCAWTAETTNAWITLTSAASGSGNGSVAYAIAANDSIVSRTGAVTLAGQTLLLVQQGAPCTYAVSPTTRTHGNGTVTNSISISTLDGCPWDIVNTNSWITLLGPASGIGSATVPYQVLTNEVTLERVGVLLIGGSSVTLTQRAAPCVFSLSLSNATHDYMTQTGQVSVTTSANCAWTVENTNYWITILTPTNVTGSATVRYCVTVNMNVSERTGRFLIAGQEFVVTQPGSPCVYSITPSSRHHSAGAETTSVSVTVAGGCEWMTDNTNSWIVVTAGLAGSGNGTVTYEVQANPTTFARTGIVMVAGHSFTVSQAGGTCTYSISPTTRNFTHLAGSGTVSVTTPANCPWSAVSSNEWITVTSPPNSNGMGTVSYSVAANPTATGRTGIVQIAGQTLTVTQAGVPCAYAIVPPGRNHGFNAETGTVTVTSAIGCLWTATSTNDWIVILAGGNGSSTGVVTYAVNANPTALVRAGVLSIAGSSFSLSQAAAPCTYALASTNLLLPSIANTGTVAFTTLVGCTWGVTNTNAWITLLSPASGSNSTTLLLGLAENPVTFPRTGQVFIANQRLTVVQAAAPCAYALSPGSRSHGFASETGLVTVTTSSNCPWTVTNANAWVTITSGASRTGSGTIGYTLAANPTGLARTGVLQVDGQTFVITQAPAPCVYGLQTTAASHAFGAGGGSISLTTLVGCAWTVVNSNAWISITSSLSGTNSTSVTYTLAANPTGLARTGIVSVAGLPFTVAQAAAPCTFTLSTSSRSHGHTAESGSFDVTTLLGCPWTISNPNGWISISGAATRTNSGTVSYSLEANPAGLSRTGVVTVAGQTFSVIQAAAPCTFTLAPSSRAHGYLTETGTVGVTTLVGCTWSASSSASWITILAGAAGTNSGSVTYRALSNDTAFVRTGIVTVAGQTFTVTQAGAPCAFAIAPSSRNHGFGLETGTVSVSTFIGCTWAASTTNFWLAILSGAEGTNSGTVTYVADVNPTALSRTGMVTAAGQTFTVVQAGAPCTFSLAPTSRHHGFAADTGTVSMTTLIGCVWNASTTNSWITLAGSGNRTNSGSLTYSLAANPTALIRTGLVTMGGQSFVITQDGAPCTYTLAPGSRAHGSGSESGSVTVTTLVGCPWTAQTADNWITITSGAAGTNSGTVNYTVAANPTAIPRSGTLTVAGQTFTVNQDGAPCTYSLTPVSWTHRSGLDTGTLAVATLVGCNWSVVNPNSWITVIAGASGSGNGSVTYTVEPNTAAGTRSGTLTIGGQAYTVSQLGSSCGYRLSPTNRFHGFGAATNTISVTATSGCPWSVVNTNPWISLLSGASGTGNGTVTYAVGTNRNSDPRTGLLNIGGEVFTITQWGTNCAFALTPRARSHGSGSETGLVVLSASSTTCAWTLQNTNNWFTMLMPSSGTGGTNISYTVTANPTIQPRSGSFTVGGESFTISQAGAPCAWTLSISARNHAFGNSTGSVNVTTLDGCAWNVENTNAWITVLSGGGTTSGTVLYTVQSNETAIARSGVLVVGGQSFTVTQDPAPCIFALQPTTRSHSGTAEGGLISVNTLLGCGWSVNNTNTWVTITAGSTGLNSGTILYTVDANPSGTPRSGTLNVAGQFFTIQQAGASCAYTIAPTARAHAAGSETGLVTVSALAGCPWTVSNPNAWITITSGLTGSGFGTVGYSVQANGSVLARTGLVTVAGQTLTVTQAGLPCTYAISPASRDHGSTNGTGTISVTASNGCTWTAVTTNNWIQITGGATGSGNGTVNYSISNNMGGSRSGSIVVAGRTFLVNQEGTLRVVRVADASIIRGQTNRVLIVLESQGDENAVGFSVCFDTNYLSFVRGVRGNAVTNTAATVNTNFLNAGRGQLGFAFALDIGSGQTFSAGSNALMELFFRASPGTAFATTPIDVKDCMTPIRPEISDVFAEPLLSGFTNGLVTLVGVCSYALNTNSATVAAAGGVAALTVTAESSCSWSVVNPNSWIQVTAGNGGSGNGTVSLSVDANGSSSARAGVLTIAGQTFTVNQAGAPCTFTVLPTNIVHGFASETGMVSLVTAGGCAWNVINTNTWITFAPGSTNGSGSASIGYSVAANPSIQPRSGNVQVDGVMVAISQSGAPCLFALTPGTRSHVAAGGTGLVSVATTAGCQWTAVSADPWITITAGASGSGSGSLGYRAGVNYLATARTGAILVADQVFTVTQPASTCGYSITPSGRNHTYQSGSSSVSVTAGTGCAWDVINTNSWITITSVTNDTGSDTVNYTYTANPGGSVRSGTILIAGRAFAVTQDQSPCAFAIAPTSGNHSAGAETGMVSVATFGGCAWSARTTNAWIQVLLPTNGVGIGTVTYAVQPNPAALVRTGWVFIADQVLPVVQAAAPCTYTVLPSSRNHGFVSETNQISITALAGCTWAVTNPNTWITFPAGTNGSGTGAVTYVVAANPSGLARSGTLTAAGQSVTINQAAAPCTYSLSQTNRGFTSAGGSGAISLTTLVGCSWAVGNANAWIQLTSSASGSGAATVTYTVQANPTSFARTGIVSIAGINHVVTQDGAPCTYTIAPTNAAFDSLAATGAVALTSIPGCTWGALSTNTWITVLAPTNGTGSGSFSFVLAANPSSQPRTGSVFVAGLTLPVTQAGAPCIYVLTPSNRVHESSGSAGIVTLTVADGCPWSVVNPSSWISITTATNGVGSAIIGYAVQANSSPAPRTGLLTIGGQVFEVSQLGITCDYAIAPSSQILSSGNVTGLVSVSAISGCSWVVVNTNSWIAIKAGESGTGNGLVRYTAAANPNPSTRVGFLTVAGQTFTVTQLGTPCTYTLAPTNRLHGSGTETGLVSVFTVTECSWTVGNTNSWITILTNASGLGNASIAYQVDPNPTPNDRTGYLTIANQSFSIMQLGAPCSISLTPTNYAHGPGAETGTVAVATLSGCPWTVTKTNTWITILSPLTNGLGTGVVTYAVSFNTNLAVRSGVIRIGGQPYTISQEGMLCTWTPSTTNNVHGAGAEAGSITITTSNLCPWSVINSNAWITFPAGTNYLGTATANYVLAANPSPSARFGTIVVAGRAITIGQAGINCTYLVNPPSRTHGFLGETSIIAVTTSNLCQWSVGNTNSWVTLFGPTNFSSSINLIYTVAPNPTTNARTGYLTVASNLYSITQIGQPFVCASNRVVECGFPWAFEPPVPAGACPNPGLTLNVLSTVTNTSGFCGSGYAVTRTWQATDGCGVTMVCTQMISVVDTSPPFLSCPPARTVACGTAWVFDAPVATDDCSGTNLTIRPFTTVTNFAGACGNTFSAIRIWEAIDGCGNRATCSQIIQVQDLAAPILTCVSNKTVECGVAWSFDIPAAFDACGGSVSINVLGTVTNLSCGNTFSATRTWEAVDGCSNRVTCSQTVLVVDTTPPVFTCPGTKVVECGLAWSFDPATAADTCGSATVVILSTVTNTAGACGNSRMVTRTWQATDACGNTALCSQLVRVVDTAAPVIVCAPARTYEFGVAWNFDNPTVFDSCSGTNVALRVVSTVTNTAGACGNTYVAIRTWDVADGCSNRSGTCAQTIRVVDTTAPSLVCAANKTVNCTQPWSFDTPTASDAGSGTNVALVVVSTITNGACGGSFTITRTWRATDACTNSSTCSQTVSGISEFSLAGRIVFPTNYPGGAASDRPVTGVTVAVSGATNLSATTGTGGTYSFAAAPLGSITVTPGGGPTNSPSTGVSTVDISLIRRHVLNIVSLDSPYKILAGDVNGSASVSTLDISFIRRLVLATTNTLPSGLWRYVPADYVFPNPASPWSAPTSRTYASLSADLAGQDFVAIKLGDVNSNWLPPAGLAGGFLPAEAGPTSLEGPGPSVTFAASRHTAQPGDVVVAQITANGLQQLTSAQGTLAWDPTVLRYQGLGSVSVAGFSEANLGLTSTEEGRLAFSWDDPAGAGVTGSDGAAFFSVSFLVVGRAGTMSPLTFTDMVTPREVGVNFTAGKFVSQSGQVMVVETALPSLPQPVFTRGGTFGVPLQTAPGKRYVLEYTDTLPATNWIALPPIDGDGTVRTLSDPSPNSAQRFYRVRIE